MDPILTSTHTVSFWDGESVEVEQVRSAWDHRADLTWNVSNINKQDKAELLLQTTCYVVVENLHDSVACNIAGLTVPPGKSISIFLPAGLHPILLDINGKHKVRVTTCEGV